MTKTLATYITTACLLAAPVLFTSGCAGTTTRQSTGEFVDDSAITAKVKTELIRDPVVKARQVEVETFKGIVQLSGFVDTDEQRSRAAQLARSVTGVRDIKNNITVKPETP
jgi:hyperosmotically inducible periplasmic protein